MKLVLAIIALILVGCDARQPRPSALDSGNPLDVAASEANLIVDPNVTAPTGLYENQGVAGTDGLCVSGDDDADLRFGVVMHFGPTLVCEGSGNAVHDGDKLSLSFDNAVCVVELSYDGRAMRFPGEVPDGCKTLCGTRASMAGGSMLRTGWTNADALRLRSRRDVLRNIPSRALCS